MSELALPVTDDLAQEGSSIVQAANSVKIVTVIDYEDAGHISKRLKEIRKNIADRFEEPKRKAFEAHRSITSLEKELLNQPLKAEKILDDKMRVWRAEQERIRREDEARLAQIAREREEERLLAEASVAEASGNQELAQAIIAQPVVAQPVVVQTSVPKIDGLKIRKVPKFRIVNVNLIPRQYLVPDEIKIGQVVRAMRADHGILGIEYYEDEVQF